MHYTGKLFYPQGAKLELDQASLSPIQGRTAFQLFSQFKKEMGEDEFDARVDAGGVTHTILVRFRKVGQTAAYAAFAHGEKDTVQKLDAVVAFLTGLDHEEDQRVLEKLRAAPSLRKIGPEDWQSVTEPGSPVAAAFFMNESALNNAILHGLMSLAGAAFLDGLGLLD
ncbi:MAG: hypothetical protein JWN24_2128 [Phycisphaerales bacterium]|nr:hypothetical protein [Phycisphaerales bacterium]